MLLIPVSFCHLLQYHSDINVNYALISNRCINWADLVFVKILPNFARSQFRIENVTRQSRWNFQSVRLLSTYPCLSLSTINQSNQIGSASKPAAVISFFTPGGDCRAVTFKSGQMKAELDPRRPAYAHEKLWKLRVIGPLSYCQNGPVLFLVILPSLFDMREIGKLISLTAAPPSKKNYPSIGL